MFKTVEEFYSPDMGEPLPQRPTPQESWSFKDVLIDTLIEIIQDARPERDFEEFVSGGLAALRDYRDQEYSKKASEQLFSDLSTTDGNMTLTDVFTFRGSIVAIAQYTNGADPVVLGDPYMIELYNAQLEDIPMVGGLLRQSVTGKMRDLSGLSMNSPEVVGMLMRAQAAGIMGNDFRTDRDTRDAIDRFNTERPGSDAMFDNGYREVRDRLDGRSGWVQV
jgi:hypothetical protein